MNASRRLPEFPPGSISLIVTKHVVFGMGMETNSLLWRSIGNWWNDTLTCVLPIKNHPSWVWTTSHSSLFIWSTNTNWEILCDLSTTFLEEFPKSSMLIAGKFDCHADVAIQCRAHWPMEHTQGFTWSHWMPPLVECLCPIAPAAAMVINFEWNTQNTNKTQLLASNYSRNQSLVVYENYTPKMDPLLSSLMRQALFKRETPGLELKSLRTFLAIKHCQRTKIRKVIKQSQSLLKIGGAYVRH